MAKVKFTEDELELLNRTVDIYDKSKGSVLEEFKKNYDWDFLIKPKWFDKDDDYQKALDSRAEQDGMARSIISKLNCISDAQWKKEIK